MTSQIIVDIKQIKLPKFEQELALAYDETKHPRDEHGRFKDEGIIKHDGKLYNVNKLINISRNKKAYQQPISEFKYELGQANKLNKDDHKRIKSAKNYLHIPILVGSSKNTESGKVSLDGYHRIHAANQLGKTHLPAIKITNEELKSARINKYKIKQAVLEINRGKDVHTYSIYGTFK